MIGKLVALGARELLRGAMSSWQSKRRIQEAETTARIETAGVRVAREVEWEVERARDNSFTDEMWSVGLFIYCVLFMIPATREAVTLGSQAMEETMPYILYVSVAAAISHAFGLRKVFTDLVNRRKIRDEVAPSSRSN